MTHCAVNMICANLWVCMIDLKYASDASKDVHFLHFYACLLEFKHKECMINGMQLVSNEL